MVELVGEASRLPWCHGVMVLVATVLLAVVVMFEAARTLIAAMVVTAFALATRPTVGSTFGSRTALTLNIALGFRKQRPVRQFVLACLGVYLQQLDLYLVAFMYSRVLYCFESSPVNL